MAVSRLCSAQSCAEGAPKWLEVAPKGFAVAARAQSVRLEWCRTGRLPCRHVWVSNGFGRCGADCGFECGALCRVRCALHQRGGSARQKVILKKKGNDQKHATGGGPEMPPPKAVPSGTSRCTFPITSLHFEGDHLRGAALSLLLRVTDHFPSFRG